jgi:uncharacterized membrane protein
MILNYVLLTVAIVLLSAALGGMVFFGAVVAPTIFRTLPEAEAGRTIRAMFGRYYSYFGVLTAVSAIPAVVVNKGAGVLVLLVGAAFFVLKHGLMPRINALRDKALAGDKAADVRFNLFHRISVQVNMAQAVLMVVAIAWLARGAGFK